MRVAAQNESKTRLEVIAEGDVKRIQPDVWIDEFGVSVFDYPQYEVQTRQPPEFTARIWVVGFSFSNPTFGSPCRVNEVLNDRELRELGVAVSRGDAPVWVLNDMLQERIPEYAPVFDHYLGGVR